MKYRIFSLCLRPLLSVLVLSQAQGAVTVPIDQTLGATEENSTTVNADVINITDGPFAIRVKGFGAGGTSTSSTDAGTGASMENIAEFTNQAGADLTVTQTIPASARVYGILLQIAGGDGGNASGNDAQYNAGNAGNAGDIGNDGASNDASITLAPGTYDDGLSIWEAITQGGNGGAVTPTGTNSEGLPEFKDGGKGGSGGSSGFIELMNSGELLVGNSSDRALVNNSVRGILAYTSGGNPGEGSVGTDGSDASFATVTSSGPISLYLAAAGGYTAYGIEAESVGSGGTASYASGEPGGDGGNGDVVTVTLTQGGDVLVDGDDSITSGAGIRAASTGGAGGLSYDSTTGGDGGTSGAATINVSNATVTTIGPNLTGLLATSNGGNGGDGGDQQDYSDAGNGGDSVEVGAIGPTINLTAGTSSVATGVSTSGSGSGGIEVSSVGGSGGQGTDYDNPFLGIGGAGDGGDGGAAKKVTLTLNNNARSITVDTAGDDSVGIRAQSVGGAGNRGGDINGDDSTSSEGSSGGSGGDADEVQVNTGSGSGSQITTSGSQSHGVILLSQGGVAGRAGDISSATSNSGKDGGKGGSGDNIFFTLGTNSSLSTTGDESLGVGIQSVGEDGARGGNISELLGNAAGNGGNGGDGGDLQIDIVSGTEILTSGSESHAIVARSLSGAGGAGGSAPDDGVAGQGGDAGNAGNSGKVGLNFIGKVVTEGDASFGVLLQSMTGTGGTAGEDRSVFYGSGGDGGDAGTVGSIGVSFDSDSELLTRGDGSHAVVVQSIAGGGGSAGNGNGAVGLGGTSASGGDGGQIVIGQNLGSVSTFGTNAIGILSQSIAGGGGTGGSANGVITIGSNGATGGSGGMTTIGILVGNTVTTAGQLAHGIVNQSIGGGGGNAGNATADGPAITVAVGGTGGAGGSGGAAKVATNDLTIITGGSNAIGIVNQSIAGGGGTGGSAYSHSVGVGFDVSVGVGGAGGSGGTAGTSTVGLSNSIVSTGSSTGLSSSPTNTNPVDAYGVVVQSIGGGGGSGGSATASALAIAVPIPETDTSFAVSASASVGGSGGIGGSGGASLAYFNDNGAVVTQGQGSHGVVVQSIGGGGGMGGDSSSTAATVAASGDAENSVSVTGTFSMGGQGGGAGSGGTATAYLGEDQNGDDSGPASIVTFGDYSNALVVQSIGGGGGNAGFGSGNTQNRGGTESIETSVNIGASGGSGGAGGAVVVEVGDSNNRIITFGSGSHGIVAQSIGGGGGTSQGGSLSFGGAASISGGGEEGGDDDDDLDLEGSVTIALGKDGGSGSEGGTVSVSSGGMIMTRGGDSAGILAQSIGGGGGVGGGAGSDASADNPVDPTTGKRRFSPGGGGSDSGDDGTTLSANFSMAVGGGGGSAANGGAVTVENDGNISTLGDWSTGIIAQSIGGGGGKAGTALAGNTDGTPALSVNVGAGGSGGDAGDGGTVTVNPNEISTAGYGAFGVHAQSIGGGGGIGVDGSTNSSGTIQLGGDISGNGGSGGNGNTVTLNGQGTVATTGDAAHGIVLQSIGGGGGTGGQGSSLALSAGSANPSVSLSVGGGSGSSGSGGAVTINNFQATIRTSGWASYGILAQSIGGGGGLVWGPRVGQDIEANSIVIGGSGSSGNGGDVSITLASGSSIQTTGLAAHGIVAQSIGGGGGIAGYPNGPSGITHYLGLPSRPSTPFGSGADVTVTVNGDITTSGNAAHGIFAQSIGGGGGFRGYETSIDMGSSSASGNYTAGAITITQSGTISVIGENSVGILAQQASPETSDTEVNVIINGSVTGGSGEQGYGVWMIANSNDTSTLTINSGGSLSAASGVAARFDSSGPGGITLNNNGTLVGNVQNGGSTSAVQVNNLAGGRFFPGDLIQANVRNDGQIFVGRGNLGGGYGRTVIAGDFAQTRGGTLIFRTDFERGQNDSLKIEGDANLDGRVRPQPVPGSRILPNRRLALIEVDGTITGGLGLDGSLGGIFDYNLGRSGNTYTIEVVGIDLRTLDSDFTGNQLAVADYLENIFLAESGSLDIFGTLDALARSQPGQIGNFFDELTPGSTLGFGARGATESQYFSDAVLNGPIFEGDTTRLAESPSAWITGPTVGRPRSASTMALQTTGSTA